MDAGRVIGSFGTMDWAEVKFVVVCSSFLLLYLLPLSLVGTSGWVSLASRTLSEWGAGSASEGDTNGWLYETYIEYTDWTGVCVTYFLAFWIGLIAVDFAIPLAKAPYIWEDYMKTANPCKGMYRYFPAKLIFKPDLKKNPDQNYLISGHPHGLWFMPYILLIEHIYYEQGFRKLVFFGASVLKYLPFLRRHLSWTGFHEVSKKDFEKALRYAYPHNICLNTTGGIQEMFYSALPQKNTEGIILHKRKGFIKLCMKYGVHIIPCYGFGNHSVYRMAFGPNSWAAKLSEWLNTSIVFWTGRWGIPWGTVPYKVPLLVVAGDIFPVEKNENPTDAEVEDVHARYIVAYKRMFNDYKVEYEKMGGPKDLILKLENAIGAEFS